MDDSCRSRIEEEHCPEAEKAADYAVKKTFAIMGVDVDSPEAVSKFQEGLRFNQSLNSIAKKSVLGGFSCILILILTYIFNILTTK